MPILPPTNSAPYDLVSNILDTTRIRLNDSVSSLVGHSGKVLQDSESFTQQATNTAWRKLMEFLANLGHTRLNQEAIIPSIPVVASIDPASQCFINWSTFFDGVNYIPAPVLPGDLIFPLKMWERVSGQNCCFPLQPNMEQILDGLPAWNKQACNRVWEWRQDAIYFPGSQQVMDFRLKYANFLPDFVDVSGVPWFLQQVPIARCQDAFAWFLCAEFVSSRGDEEASIDFTARAEKAAKLIMNREVRQKQRVNVRRIPRSGPSSRGRQGWGIL